MSLPREKLCRFDYGKCALAFRKAQGKFQALAFVTPRERIGYKSCHSDQKRRKALAVFLRFLLGLIG